MRFEANTKPITDGLDLGIINSNITKFYQKSCIVELNIEEDALRVNTEVSSIKSELVFHGHTSNDDDNRHIFVDSLLFKNLLSSIDADTITFDISDNTLTVYAGRSNFKLPQVIGESDIELNRPTQLDAAENLIEVDKSAWKFIQDYQMYSISMSFLHPVYRLVWMGNSGNVIVGDYDNSIFTTSTKSQLPNTCLVEDTIVNLLNNVPEGSTLIPVGRNYEIKVDLDPYSYVCEFAPKLESDEGIGDYNSDIILGLFNHEDGIHVNTDKLNVYLSQAELFSKANDDTIKLVCDNASLSLVNQNVNCKVETNNPFDPFEVNFNIKLLKDVFAHFDNNEIDICPLVQDEQVSGIVAWTDNLSTVLGGVD